MDGFASLAMTEGFDTRRLRSRIRQLAWFVGLWAAGVASVGAVAWVLRLWIHA